MKPMVISYLPDSGGLREAVALYTKSLLSIPLHFPARSKTPTSRSMTTASWGFSRR